MDAKKDVSETSPDSDEEGKIGELIEAYKSYRNALYGQALRLTKNPGEAQELVQDTFEKAFRYIRHYESNSNMKAWFFKILRNTFISFYRRRKKEAEAVENLGAMSDQEEEAHEAAGSQLEGIDDQMAYALEDVAIDFRIPLILYAIHEMSYKEIAEVVGDIPMGTVMSRIHRAREKLRQTLAAYARNRGIDPTIPMRKKKNTEEAA